MATDASLCTAVVWTVFDNSGIMVPGAKINTYAAGTSTPLATYTDAGLTVPNTNPVICDSAGRATVFLQNQPYKFVVTDASNVTLYTQDHVTGGANGLRQVCNGRLTGTSGNPDTDTNSTTTVYFTPYLGNFVALYTGSTWLAYTFTELSLSLSGLATSTNADIFLYVNAGVLTLQYVAWTNDSTRASAIALQDGIYVLGSDHTKRYLGTIRNIASTPGTTTDTAAQRFIWNYYNRLDRAMRVTATGTWTGSTGAGYRQANNSSANQLAFIIGESEVTVHAAVYATFTATGTVECSVAIGEDSTGSAAANCFAGLVANVTGAHVALSSLYSKGPTLGVGYHTLVWLELNNALGMTWVGAAGGIQSGISGWLQG